VQIVIEEKTVLPHDRIQAALARVTERRMADIVDQRQGFDQIDIEAELGCDGAGNLRNLNGVGEPVAEVVGVSPGEDLSLGFQATKGAGVYDPVTIALEVVAVGVRRFPMAAAEGAVHGIARKHEGSVAKEHSSRQPSAAGI
jgi:hypothetical protein